MTVTLNIESAAQLIPVFLMKFRQEHPEAILISAIVLCIISILKKRI